MNEHELHGGARYVGGKVEKAAGDVIGKDDWKVGGVVNQVSGAAENLFGRVQSVAADVADTTPHLIADAQDRVGEAAARSAEAARRGARAAGNAVRSNDRVVWAAAAALAGFAIGWLVNARRD